MSAFVSLWHFHLNWKENFENNCYLDLKWVSEKWLLNKNKCSLTEWVKLAKEIEKISFCNTMIIPPASNISQCMIGGNTQTNVCITKDIIMTHKFGAYSKTWVSSDHPCKQQIFQISLPSSCSSHLQKTPFVSSSLSQFLFPLFKASFQLWQAAGLRLDTPWCKQEGDRSHYCPQRTSMEQVPEAPGKRRCALGTPTTAACAWGWAGGVLQAPLISYGSLGLGPSHPAATAPHSLVFNLKFLRGEEKS